MDPADQRHGQLVLGGGGITADPGIDLGSETWLHDVFACPLHRDVCVSVTEFARTTDLVQSDIRVPGSSAHADRRASRARHCLLRLLRQWYEAMWRLRRAGFTLRGNFSCENFLVYRPKQQQPARKKRGRAQRRKADPQAEDKLEVRMTGRLHLSRYSREDAVEDDRTFVWSVRGVLNLREHVPVDIGDWLELINSDGVGNEYLIRYNIALMDPRAGFYVLMSLRRRIEYLRRQRPDVYASILYLMRDYQDWNSQLLHFSNSLMESARLHVLNQSRKTPEEAFDPNLRGILTVIRNCAEHPAKKFDRFMLMILDEDFRAFAAQLQRAMFRTGQLGFLHLETAMG